MKVLRAAVIALIGLSSVHAAPPATVPKTFLPDVHAAELDWNRDWPARWVPASTPLRGAIVPVAEPAALLGVRTTRVANFHSQHDSSDFQSLAALFSPLASPTWETEGLNSTPVEGVRQKADFLPAGEPDASLVFRFVSGRQSGEAPHLTVAIDRTTFALYEPQAPATHLVVLLPGMLGTPEQILEPLILHLRTRGCAVLRMLAHPARTTQSAHLDIDPDREGSFQEAGSKLASLYGDRIAECAYSVEAALAYVDSQRPALALLPRIGVGTSGGAIMLPTVCALHPEQWSGAVLIGGGVDFWLISERSNYRNLVNAVKVRWTRPPTEIEDETLDREYLAHARLDPFHTAAALRGTPTFVIRGEADRAVPAVLGAMLTARIHSSRPESREIATPIGHESLFITLPARFDEISDFIKARTRTTH